jgi:hypothetical protein
MEGERAGEVRKCGGLLSLSPLFGSGFGMNEKTEAGDIGQQD